MKRLSFDEYLESKCRLRESTLHSPIIESAYMMKRYCKFPTGDKISKQMITLKPNDVVSIKWRYDRHGRLAESITINEEIIEAFWKQEKIEKWLQQTCTEIIENTSKY